MEVQVREGKVCHGCDRWKEWSAYDNDSGSPDGKNRKCRDCLRAGKLARRMAQYGITVDEYDRLREMQGYCCLICRTPETELARELHVDHDHKTGTVRGLLCVSCNTGLGSFKDDPDRLLAAIVYLARRGADETWEGLVGRLLRQGA